MEIICNEWENQFETINRWRSFKRRLSKFKLCHRRYQVLRFTIQLMRKTESSSVVCRRALLILRVFVQMSRLHLRKVVLYPSAPPVLLSLSLYSPVSVRSTVEVN